ncbi:exodeoxyribonuclease III [Pikeienuella piscinae]|uniref:Exodeoxyribonuclease III n=1 Tax=Pikeienuella piscinae TaxID=2748098 RepID=A0A7L5C1B8_9RHOB|nr:exodeoxyribonuclease III [Pikeienuella piscinae]QIE56276.1 exodeoxyribonuclease III [Pikeienuella piscinae]
MPVTVCTWNINSVRLREGIVLRLLREEAPDILCLQETKSPVEKIPLEGFTGLGYTHVLSRGDKGYNGVAILSKLPLDPVDPQNFGGKGDARHVVGRLKSGVEIHNVYLPAGGDIPDPAVNEKFDHKLRFVDDLTRWGEASKASAILVGDLNIAPREDDVWSHKQLLKVVSHTPVEVAAFERARAAGRWVDVTRADHGDGQLYTWWSYRAKDWDAADKGRRLDHVWATPDIAPAPGAGGSRVLRAVRGWEKPSDHAPVFATFDI